VLFGFKKDGESEEQAYRYPKDNWTAAEARSHCGSHGGSFEAAAPAASSAPATLEILAVRDETLDGRKYVVAPVILMVEGVHVGFSGDRVFYPKDEIENPNSIWNGVPVTLRHPMKDGSPVSANDPTVLAAQGLGRIFNVRAEDGKRKGEVWIDIEKAEMVSPGLIAAIRGGSPLEVSTGIYHNVDDTSGEWNGEAYSMIARDYVLDHLALLPGGTGACSWADGCGIRANEQGQEELMDKEIADHSKFRNVIARILSAVGLTLNEQSHSDIEKALREKLQDLLAPHRVWLREVYDKEVIYEVTEIDATGMVMGAETLYRRGYLIDADGNVTLGEKAIEVKQEISYVPVANETAGNTDEIKIVKEDEMDKTKMADALIACDRTRFTEADKPWLMTMEVCQLEKLQAVEVKPTISAAGPDPQQTDAKETKPPTFNEVLATADVKTQAMIKRGLASYDAEIAALVAGIKKNPRNKFTDEWLSSRSIEELQALSQFGDVEINYTGQTGGPPAREATHTSRPIPQVWDLSGKPKETVQAQK
jgi:hypothetical protein